MKLNALQRTIYGNREYLPKLLHSKAPIAKEVLEEFIKEERKERLRLPNAMLVSNHKRTERLLIEQLENGKISKDLFLEQINENRQQLNNLLNEV